jgi:hypothetical protein
LQWDLSGFLCGNIVSGYQLSVVRCWLSVVRC